MENSRVPAEKIFNPDLKEAIVTMQEDNSKENVDKMITEVVKAKFIYLQRLFLQHRLLQKTVRLL